MNICIGIVSYLPEDEEIREIRKSRIISLINKCNDHFKFDILVIAQNWKDLKFNDNVYIDYYNDALGIVPARIKLREKFINSSYDYMIMLDDDTELYDDQKEYDKYINCIINNKNDFYWFGRYYLRLSCISKDAFKKINFDPSIIPEEGTGWEDVIFNKRCRKKFSSMNIVCNLISLNREVDYCKDKYSTWNNIDKELWQRNFASTQKILDKENLRIYR